MSDTYPLLLPTENNRAWLLRIGASVTSALWIPEDRLWLINGSFLNPRIAAACGYSIYRPADGE